MIRKGIKAWVDGKTTEAIELLARAKRANPKDYRIFWILGNAYRDNEQYKEAIDAYLKSIEVKTINPYPEYIEWDYNEGQYKERESPDGDYMIWWDLGKVYILNNQFKEAVDAYLKAIELCPYDKYDFITISIHPYVSTIRKIDIINELGDLYFDNGKYSEAIVFYSQGVYDDKVFLRLSESYELNGQFEEAAKILNNGNRRGGDYRFSIELAELYCRHGKYKEAIDSLLISMSKYNFNIKEKDIYYCLLEWKDKYKIENLYKEAIDYLTEIAETESAKIAEMESAKTAETKPNGSLSSLIFGLLGVTNDAKSNNQDYKLPLIWGLLGTSYFMNGQYKEAIDSLLKSTGMKHENYTAWNLLGASYYKTEQREDAIEAFLTAEALGGDKDFCQFMLWKLDTSSKAKKVKEPKDNIIWKILNEDKQ